MSSKCRKNKGTRKHSCLTCWEETESWRQQGSQGAGGEVTNRDQRETILNELQASSIPGGWQVHLPRS